LKTYFCQLAGQRLGAIERFQGEVAGIIP
jgi:hypothetical protein